LFGSKTKLESLKHCLLSIGGEKHMIERKNFTKDGRSSFTI